MRACASHARVACTCCSCPALLCVPLLCIRVLRAFVLGVWCTCAGFSQIVRHPLANVVDIAGVCRPVLCAGVHACVIALASPIRVLRVPAVHALAVHASVMRACASHARVACTCCSCPCCACPRCALSCGACVVLVQRSPTPCGARRHRRQHTPDQPLVGPSDDRPDTYSPCLCSFLDPLQRTDPLDFDGKRTLQRPQASPLERADVGRHAEFLCTFTVCKDGAHHVHVQRRGWCHLKARDLLFLAGYHTSRLQPCNAGHRPSSAHCAVTLWTLERSLSSRPR